MYVNTKPMLGHKPEQEFLSLTIGIALIFKKKKKKCSRHCLPALNEIQMLNQKILTEWEKMYVRASDKWKHNHTLHTTGLP